MWEKVRKPAIRKWLDDNRYEYDWAARGRSAEAAAWCQSLFDEAAIDAGLSSAAVFFDLTKAFEMVRLEDVWGAGVECGFPLPMLRVSLETFASRDASLIKSP